MDAGKLVSWVDLGTIGGAAIGVSLIVRFLKELFPWFQGRRTLVLAWVVSFLVNWVVHSSTGGIKGGPLIITSLVVAAMAVGLREGQRAVMGIGGKKPGGIRQPPAAAPESGGGHVKGDDDGDDRD